MPKTSHSDRPSPNAGTPLRLGVGHFLLWMTTCAIVLTGYNVLNDPREFTPAESAFSSVFQLAMSLGYSLALTAVLVLLARRTWGDRRFPTHAGHWLAIMGVITLVIDGGSLAGVKLFAAWQAVNWNRYWNEYQTVAWSLGTAIGMALLVGVRQEFRWRIVVAAIVAYTSLHALIFGLGAADIFVHWLSDSFDILCVNILATGMAAIAWAAYRDLALSVPRDWLHWVGAAAWLGLAAIQIGAILYFRAWQ
jgi:hypothetical protein